jgi:addiction module HigA family antidote
MPIHNPLHPGEIVNEILIEGAGLSVTGAAKKLSINRTTLSRLFNGHSGISAEMAVRLSKLLSNTDIMMWMNLQRDYEIWYAKKHTANIRITPLKAA